jgi:hypothetical protein
MDVSQTHSCAYAENQRAVVYDIPAPIALSIQDGSKLSMWRAISTYGDDSNYSSCTYNYGMHLYRIPISLDKEYTCIGQRV